MLFNILVVASLIIVVGYVIQTKRELEEKFNREILAVIKSNIKTAEKYESKLNVLEEEVLPLFSEFEIAEKNIADLIYIAWGITNKDIENKKEDNFIDKIQDRYLSDNPVIEEFRHKTSPFILKELVDTLNGKDYKFVNARGFHIDVNSKNARAFVSKNSGYELNEYSRQKNGVRQYTLEVKWKDM